MLSRACARRARRLPGAAAHVSKRGMASALERLKWRVDFLWTQRVRGFDTPTAPWFDAEGTAAFERELAACAAYLEFGTGGSTIAAGRSGKPALSVDSDRFYTAAVRKGLGPESRVEIVDADIGMTVEWGWPLLRAPTPARVARWRRYVDAPFARLGGRPFPDFVLVDGRFRRACLLETARQAALRGAVATVMFDDYGAPGRDHYAAVEPILGTPRRAGRAALFDVGRQAVTEAQVAEAAADPS